jgi:hypothetical protein
VKEKNCPSCNELDHDCGGHWSRRVFPAARNGMPTSRPTLDAYDAAHLADNADYSVYEERE